MCISWEQWRAVEPRYQCPRKPGLRVPRGSLNFRKANSWRKAPSSVAPKTRLCQALEWRQPLWWNVPRKTHSTPHVPLMPAVLLSQCDSLVSETDKVVTTPSTYCCCLVAKSCSLFWDPMGCNLLGSSVHRDSPGRILERVAIQQNFWLEDQTWASPALQADSTLSHLGSLPVYAFCIKGSSGLVQKTDSGDKAEARCRGCHHEDQPCEKGIWRGGGPGARVKLRLA